MFAGLTNRLSWDLGTLLRSLVRPHSFTSVQVAIIKANFMYIF